MKIKKILMGKKFCHEKGLTPLQQKVLYDFPCDDLLSMFGGFYAVFYSSCVSVSKGAESFGLVKINSGLYTAASYALQLYEESNKTKEELENVYLTGLGMCGAYVSVAEGFLKMLYDATNESFEDDVDFINPLWTGSISILISERI